MKTLTSSILSMAIFVVCAFLSLILIGACIASKSWGLLVWDIVTLIGSVLCVVLAYKSARKYEDLIREAISKLMMESAIRDFKAFCDAVKEAIPEPETKKEEKAAEL